MTYRKLFRLLLLGSTLVLGGVWWFSQKNHAEVSYRRPPAGHFYSISLDFCTIALSHDESNPFANDWLDFEHWVYKSSWHELRDEYGLTGRFGHGRNSLHRDSLWFPLWFPYLLFVGSAFVFTRFMESRSSAGKEKELAAGSAAE